MTLITTLIFIPVLTCILLSLNLLLAPSVPDLEKMSVYEAGIQPTGNPRGQFSISFYMVAILFLCFDIEIAVIYPLSTILGEVGIYGFIVGIIFLGILTVGFVFEYGSGALRFTNASDTSDEILYYTPTFYPLANLFWDKGVLI